MSFPDAKIGKNVTQDFVCCHFAEDFGEVVDGGAEVFAHEVAAEAKLKAVLHFLYVGEGAGEGFVVAHVGDYHVALRDGGECSTAHKELLEPVEVAP